MLLLEDTGVISGALLYLRQDEILVRYRGNQSRLDFIEGAIVSGTTIGAAAGAALGAALGVSLVVGITLHLWQFSCSFALLCFS